jgi:hypothetical protein
MLNRTFVLPLLFLPVLAATGAGCAADTGPTEPAPVPAAHDTERVTLASRGDHARACARTDQRPEPRTRSGGRRDAGSGEPASRLR